MHTNTQSNQLPFIVTHTFKKHKLTNGVCASTPPPLACSCSLGRCWVDLKTKHNRKQRILNCDYFWLRLLNTSRIGPSPCAPSTTLWNYHSTEKCLLLTTCIKNSKHWTLWSPLQGIRTTWSTENHKVEFITLVKVICSVWSWLKYQKPELSELNLIYSYIIFIIYHRVSMQSLAT